MPTKSTPKFIFFGSSRFSVIVLDELERAGFSPTAVVTTPDKPQGRKMILTPTPVKTWALAKKIPILDPAKLDDYKADLFIVASYGKIISQAVLDLPKHKTLNIHPSLLPKYRGASPLQSAMLDDTKETGVTIMQVDAQMDHGPIVAQEKVRIGEAGLEKSDLTEWPTYEIFEELMAKKGAQLLARVMPDWVAGKIQAMPQNHAAATFTKKIKKEDGLIDLSMQYNAFRKIQAFHDWPQAYFFIEHGGKNLRIKITKASWQDAIADAPAKLVIEKVIPEGSREMPYEDFLRGLH
ncbi:MAG: methionyl-tRNA formyltransferase [Candidatus Taylorbacteria bacterium]